MRKPIAFSVLTPTGSRFRASLDDVAQLRHRDLSVRTCDDGKTIAVRSWWETRETFYSPIYRPARPARRATA